MPALFSADRSSMSMFTGPVTRALRDVRSADEASTRLGRQLMTGRKLETSADGPSAWLAAGRAGAAAGYLDAIHTGLNEAATSIRVADQTMDAIGRHLELMQTNLQQAIQLPVGDPARDGLIADFSVVRQQVDDLVNTPVAGGVQDLFHGSNIDVLVGLHGERRTVHAQQIDTGPGGLDVPVVDGTATVADMQNALSALETSQAMLTVRRQSLAADAAGISRFDAQHQQLSQFYVSHAEALAAADPAEAALKLQSVGVRRSLAMESLSSISGLRGAVLELLK